MVGHDWYQRSAEINIPTLVTGTSIGNLNTAILRQNFADATEGRLNQINPNDPNAKKVGGQLVYKNRLYVSAYS